MGDAVRHHLRRINDHQESKAWAESVKKIHTCLGIDQSTLSALQCYANFANYRGSEPSSWRVLAWRAFPRASSLFIPHLKPFEINEVRDQIARQNAISQITSAAPFEELTVPFEDLAPTPYEIQAAAYFPDVKSFEARTEIERLLAAPGEDAFARGYVIRYRDFFNNDKTANMIDELGNAGSVVEGAARMQPQALFNRLAEIREMKAWGPQTLRMGS